MTADRAFEAVSFDLFGTLVTVDRRADPAGAVASELARRDVTLPDDWEAAYTESHRPAAPGREVPLTAHVIDALRSRPTAAGSAPDPATVRAALQAAFDREVALREGARRAVTAAAAQGPVGILSNCSVRGLAEQTLDRVDLDPATVDAVVTSVDVGWRKPNACAFEAVASALDVPPSGLLHVGDDPETDGGAAAVGATWVDVTTTALPTVASRLEDGKWP